MLTEFQKKLEDISDEEIYDLLEEGEEYANVKANEKLFSVQRAFHLR
jgi:hypothetical protein